MAAFVFGLLAAAATARANDVSDELTVGEIKNSGTTQSYVSDRAAGSIDASDELSFSLGAGITRYEQTKTSKPGDIFQLSLGSSYLPSPHWAFDLDGYLSPRSVDIERVQSAQTRVHDKTSSLGFALNAEYDTAGDGDYESVVDASIGSTSYSTTQRLRTRGQNPNAMPSATTASKPEQASLLQTRALASFTETLFRDTDATLAFGWYFYNRDPTDSGYYGTNVFGRGAIGDGIPVLPLRYTLRPSLAHRFGALSLRVYYQYGRYEYAGQSSDIVGLKAQYKFSHLVRAWLSGNFQHDTDALTILWLSAGARLVF